MTRSVSPPARAQLNLGFWLHGLTPVAIVFHALWGLLRLHFPALGGTGQDARGTTSEFPRLHCSVSKDARGSAFHRRA